MGTALHDRAVLHHQDRVRRTDRRETVGDHDGGTAFQRGAQRLLDGGLIGRVQRGGGLVEDDHPRLGDQQAGDRQALPLAAGEPVAALPHHGVQPVGQGPDHVFEPGRRSASHICSSVASGRARRRLEAMLSWNR